jgi:hypothetical protein
VADCLSPALGAVAIGFLSFEKALLKAVREIRKGGGIFSSG